MTAIRAWTFGLGLLLAAGCQSAGLAHRSLPLNEETREWLQEGTQSRITPAVRAAAAPLFLCRTRAQKIHTVMDLLQRDFTYDHRESIYAAARTADDLVLGGVFGDCTVPEGHAMLEVWGDQGPQWVNPSWGNIYPPHPVAGNVLPDGYLWARAGRDYWDMGIRSVEDLRNLLYETARGADRDEVENATYGAPVPRN